MKQRWSNRALFNLIWPLVIEQFLVMLMGLVATMMVSPIGEFAISGVNIIDNINNLFIIAFAALSTGGAVVVSQYIGRGKYDNASLAAKQLIYIVVIDSAAIAAIALLFREPVIRTIYGNLESDVMSAAMTFFFFSALSYPVLALYSVFAALFRSMGNSQIPMRVSFLMNVLHVALNLLFMHVFTMGVTGVALSSLVSRTVSAAAIVTILLSSSRYPVSLSGTLKIKLVPSVLRQILNIGVPTGLEHSMFMVGRLLTQRIFPYFGMIAANAIASMISSVSFMAGNAFGFALLTVVGQNIGAGDIAAAKSDTVKIMRIAWLVVFIISGTTLLLTNFLTGFFNLSETSQTSANLFLRVHSVTMIIGWSFSFVLPNALRAAGDARYVMVVAAVSMWL
ncbi:MAG: MATE family efflux transporter, partial [Treponema sp.]|nr:MATE family efflux transporter [Treponema sp.]